MCYIVAMIFKGLAIAAILPAALMLATAQVPLSTPATHHPASTQQAQSTYPSAPAQASGVTGADPQQQQPMVVALPAPKVTPWALHDKILWGATVVLAILGYVGVMLALSTLKKIERHTEAFEDSINALDTTAKTAATAAETAAKAADTAGTAAETATKTAEIATTAIETAAKVSEAATAAVAIASKAAEAAGTAAETAAKAAEAATAAATAALDTAQAALLQAQALVHAERPWVLVTAEPSHGVESSFEITATNRGRSPARVTAALDQVLFAADEAHLPDFPQLKPVETGKRFVPIILLPGESAVLKTFSRDDARGFCDSDEMFKSIESWDQRLFLVGQVSYENLLTAAGSPGHQTNWCSWYIHGKQRSALVPAGGAAYNAHT